MLTSPSSPPTVGDLKRALNHKDIESQLQKTQPNRVDQILFHASSNKGMAENLLERVRALRDALNGAIPPPPTAPAKEVYCGFLALLEGNASDMENIIRDIGSVLSDIETNF